ncbi:unnamed protein product [Darwinula stevensoni]|uniref:Uncharacterized protein n=1 Tax=Darwinula stevensoni TaxID=69355 RepID=A0A7R8XDA8_9CRUS|nr:unnamed protein product [Darwinula stevensoni]CAG0889656.1 unnamed protein product [Darwinula stevensoni]
MGDPGEVAQLQYSETVIEILQQSGLEWDSRAFPPVPLETERRNGGRGLLESLSLILTGSLLHLPLLKVWFSAPILITSLRIDL